MENCGSSAFIGTNKYVLQHDSVIVILPTITVIITFICL